MFLILIFLVSAYSLKIFHDTRGVTFYAPRAKTDNEKMLLLASEYESNGLLRWPGSVHTLNDGKGRAELREFWIIFIALIQKLFPKEKQCTEHVNITLSIISQSLTTLLIYQISNFFIPSYAAFSISIIYLISAWSTEVVLYLGHIIYSQVWFLFSLAFILIAYLNQENIFLFSLFIFISGLLTSICFTASSASRKFPPILILCQLYLCINIFSEYADKAIILTLFFIGIILLLSKTFLPKIFKFLNKILIYSLSNSQKNIKERNIFFIFNFFYPIAIISFIVIFPAITVEKFNSYLETQFIFALGILSGFSVVLMPNPIINLKKYMIFLDISSWASHFSAYPDQKKVFGKKLPKNFRGEGIRWLPPFFWSVMPIEIILFGLTLISMVFCYFIGEISLLNVFIIVLIGLIPTLIVEITNGLQVGKSYLSSLTGVLITVVLGFKYFEITFDKFVPYLLTTLTIIQLIRSFITYKNDLLPCRMGPARLREFLFKNNIKSFYTYKTSYNNAFVKTLIYGFESKINVNFVQTIKECPKDSIFVVPPTSSKSLSMETESEAILNGDFREDPTLNDLLDNNSLQKYALAKFKTFGCSKYYVNESEVTSYRYHILNQISDHDRLLSLGWVLDLKLLNK